MKYQLIPRQICFRDGVAVGGCFYNRITPKSRLNEVESRVIKLPTDHYDFDGPIDYLGKTESEIKEDVKEFCKKEGIEINQ